MADLFLIADIIGIIAFSISGFLVGVRHRLDLLGIAIAATLTALGGGIVRDLLLDRTPYAFSHYYPLLALLGALGASVLFKLYHRDRLEHGWIFIISDTIGLVAFSIAGALLGIGAEFNVFGVMTLGFITAVGGSLLRDTMINQLPAVLMSDFYGSIALIVALLLYGLHVSIGISNTSLLIVALFATALRIVAFKRGWHLPTPKD